MTLSELIRAALEELERPNDEATRSLWHDRLQSYANEAVADLYTTFRPWRRETVQAVGGHIDLGQLTVPCGKMLGVEHHGMRIPFHYGADTNELIVPGWGSEPLTVVYRIAPATLRKDTDQTGLPAACEPLIVLYMTARDRANGDAASQNGATMRLSLYEAQKKRLRMDFDEPPVCRLCTYW